MGCTIRRCYWQDIGQESLGGTHANAIYPAIHIHSSYIRRHLA